MKKITMEEFVTLYNSSENRKEALAKTGLSQQSIYARIEKCKKHNIPIKKFPKGDNTDWAAVKAAAEKALKK